MGLIGSAMAHVESGTMQAQGEAETAKLMLPEGSSAVSARDMEAIKLALHSALSDRAEANPTDFSPLIAELAVVAVWFDGGVAHIGPWELGVRKHQIVLVRRPPPTPTRLFYVARLGRTAEQQWRVSQIDIEVVHGS
ncbi:hypothetical protein [Montanilutibacter psychrotolerans]|uniref:Uncharacterized protein n=1 Tax=Montanilutibacter psychrotolerans TaxID=1327343 RepID=A0A3M8SQG6_9GAMM|nr:hypothetical protein [Lysobacter psychrotolerans]RNF83578.1 hypothetical protein EER27_09285 [Lysobacter psychrotolerans]